jgi:tetratricopeptide (TPR) repeat protein
VAQGLFRKAVTLDPAFARAWSGLSFTHFQNAFLLKPDDRTLEVERAYETAGRSLEADEYDPAAHWAMGRALWLRGAGERSIAELENSVLLAPNFNLGHYALAFVNSQSGETAKAIDAADYARKLSPFDPLLFGILASRAIALYRSGAYEAAAEAAVRAAERPNAHHHIWMIAALCLSAAGRMAEASEFAIRIRTAQPGYHVNDFVSAFHFSPGAQAAFREQARQIGLG